MFIDSIDINLNSSGGSTFYKLVSTLIYHPSFIYNVSFVLELTDNIMLLNTKHIGLWNNHKKLGIWSWIILYIGHNYMILVQTAFKTNIFSILELGLFFFFFFWLCAQFHQDWWFNSWGNKIWIPRTFVENIKKC